MAEDSYLWTTGGAGDGSATFTRADWSEILRILGACMDDEGVAPAYLNALAPSTTGANNCRIATGGALVDGKPYSNSANVDVTITSAVGGGNTRIDRVVLRADWTAQTVRITRIAGTDAASPTAPAITQTPGTTYDIKLCQCLVNTVGTVTITDERVFAKPGTNAIVTAAITDLAVTTAKINDDAVTAAKIADSAIDDAAKIVDGTITAAKIANRTRTFLVQAIAASGATETLPGVQMPNGVTTAADGRFYVPSDFVSTMTVTPVITCVGSPTGNVNLAVGAVYGADGESYFANDNSVAATNVAVPGAANANKLCTTIQASLSSVAAGDYVQLSLTRAGAAGGDTSTSDQIYAVGFLVSYTADS